MHRRPATPAPPESAWSHAPSTASRRARTSGGAPSSASSARSPAIGSPVVKAPGVIVGTPGSDAAARSCASNSSSVAAFELRMKLGSRNVPASRLSANAAGADEGAGEAAAGAVGAAGAAGAAGVAGAVGVFGPDIQSDVMRGGAGLDMLTNVRAAPRCHASAPRAANKA